MRLHINDRFTQTILNHVRERIIFLFKQQPDSAPLIRQFQNQFSDSLGKTIEKYCGTTYGEDQRNIPICLVFCFSLEFAIVLMI